MVQLEDPTQRTNQPLGVHHGTSVNPLLKLSGWWLTYPSEKSWSEFVTWDDDIPFPTVSGKSLEAGGG